MHSQRTGQDAGNGPSVVPRLEVSPGKDVLVAPPAFALGGGVIDALFALTDNIKFKSKVNSALYGLLQVRTAGQGGGC